MSHSGKYRRRITIQQPVESAASASGETTLSWVPLDVVWAEVLERGSREVYRAQQVNPEVTVAFNIRYRSDVTADMRVTWDGRTFHLGGPPIPDARHTETTLHCVEQA